MLTNPYTKETFDFMPHDLCAGFEINDAVKSIYTKYKGQCEQFLTSIVTADHSLHKYYVYVWYAKATPKRYFYVGKGTGNRWKHILSDIEKFKKGKHNIRYQHYSQIQDKWGIDCDIVINDLTEYEALIYEECKKLELLKSGEILLNIEGIPSEYLLQDWNGEYATYPILQKSPFFTRYLDDIGDPFFDEVDLSYLMKTYFYPYYVDTADFNVIQAKSIITGWLMAHNAKIYKTPAAGIQSVIVQGVLRYDRYAEYRSRGIKIYSSKDIIDRITETGCS